MSYSVIVTGATGMVGKAVLLECLEDEKIERVLSISRSTSGIEDEKLSELLVEDFSDLRNSTIEDLSSYDACFHSMGISAFGVSKADYYHITFEYSQILADKLYEANPNMLFTYVSGLGTDENSSATWSKVKSKTEKYILEKGFKDAYAYRPGMIIPEKGIKTKTKWYGIMYFLMTPFYSILKKNGFATTSTILGRSMIALLESAYGEKYVYNRDINRIGG